MSRLLLHFHANEENHEEGSQESCKKGFKESHEEGREENIAKGFC